MGGCSGCIVARVSQDPQPTLAVKFGGMVKGVCVCVSPPPPAAPFALVLTPPACADIKRRETGSYLNATAGNKGITTWALEPMTGSLAPTKVTTGAGFNRDLLCLTFSGDREWIYGGTSSGDFVCVNVRAPFS